MLKYEIQLLNKFVGPYFKETTKIPLAKRYQELIKLADFVLLKMKRLPPFKIFYLPLSIRKGIAFLLVHQEGLVVVLLLYFRGKTFKGGCRGLTK